MKIWKWSDFEDEKSLLSQLKKVDPINLQGIAQMILGKISGVWLKLVKAENLHHNQREIWQPLCDIAKEEYIWNTDNPLGSLLVLPYPIIVVNEKLEQPNTSRTSNSPELF